MRVACLINRSENNENQIKRQIASNIFIFAFRSSVTVKENSAKAAIKEYFKGGVDTFLPHVSINCVVLAYRHPDLQVLVHRMPGHDSWLLPGGYVKRTESLDDAAYRNLRLAGINEVFLRQIRTFGDPHRVTGISGLTDTSPEHMEILEWAKQRFVTVVYYGLIDQNRINVVPGGLLKDFKWSDVDRPDRMVMDHAMIVEETRKLMAIELLNHPIASKLLPDTFTLNELRGLFEAILNRRIDRGTFRRKILKLGIVEQIDQRKDPIGRPSHLFRFNPVAYHRFLSEEIRFGI